MTLRGSSSGTGPGPATRPLSPAAAAPFATSFNSGGGFQTTGQGMAMALGASGNSNGNASEHCGSRKRLLFTRQQQLRAESDGRMHAALEATVKNNRRVNLITDVAKENS